MRGFNKTGGTADFFAYNASTPAKIWSVADGEFVTPVDADVADYRIAATPSTPADWFAAAAPSGTVEYELRLRGSTLATSPVIYEDSDTIDATPTSDLGTLLDV